MWLNWFKPESTIGKYIRYNSSIVTEPEINHQVCLNLTVFYHGLIDANTFKRLEAELQYLVFQNNVIDHAITLLKYIQDHPTLYQSYHGFQLYYNNLVIARVIQDKARSDPDVKLLQVNINVVPN